MGNNRMIQVGDIVRWYENNKPTDLISVVMSVSNAHFHYLYDVDVQGYGTHYREGTSWRVVG